MNAEEYAENQYMRDGQPISYAEYLAYYGNPERHVYLMSEVEKACRCCHTYSYAGGTGYIDFMNDDPALAEVGIWYTPAEAERLGHLREIALQDLEDAGYRLPGHVRCQRKGCRHWHVTRDPYAPAVDERYCAQHQPGKGSGE